MTVPSAKVGDSRLSEKVLVRPFKERTNSAVRVDLYSLSHPSSMSKLDGIQALSSKPVLLNMPRPSFVTFGNSESHRQKRYSAAEQALASSLHRTAACVHSPRDLQIKAFEQATFHLSTQAQETKERIEQLRSQLVNRNVNRSTHIGFLKERWREEHRLKSIEEETRKIQEQLHTLRRSSRPNSSIHEARSQTIDEKKQANLAKFFAHSITRASVSSHKSRESFLATSERAARRVTIGDVAPLCLRANPTPSYTKSRARAQSLDTSRQSGGTGSQDSNFNREKLSSLMMLQSPAQLSSVSEVPTPTRSPSLSPITGSVGTSSSLRLCLTPPAWNSPSLKLKRPTGIIAERRGLSDIHEDIEGDGKVTIFSPAKSRCKADLFAELFDQQHVEMPQYAKMLLDGFGRDPVSDKSALVLTPPPKNRNHGPPSSPPRVDLSTSDSDPFVVVASPSIPTLELQQAVTKKPSRRTLFGVPEGLASRVLSPLSTPPKPKLGVRVPLDASLSSPSPSKTSPFKVKFGGESPPKRREGSSPIKGLFLKSRAPDPSATPDTRETTRGVYIPHSQRARDLRHDSEESLSGHLTLKLPKRVTRRFSNFLRT